MNRIIEIPAICLEISDTDLDGTLNWYEAMDYASKLKDRWRLPTITELNVIYKQRESIGGFGASYYWSSSESNANLAWYQYFSSGNQYNSCKYYYNRVRLVRNI